MELATRLNRIDDPMLVMDPDADYRLPDLQEACRSLHNELMTSGLMGEARRAISVLAEPGTREQRLLDNLLLDNPNPTWVGSE